jgi:DNA-binding IclR family transcriptional regulator
LAQRPSLSPGFPVEGRVVKSAQRTLELFEYFAERQEQVSVSDISRALDYPQSSTSALLKSLTALGYLEYDAKARLYLPTLRFALLGGWIHDSFFRDGNLLVLMQELRQQTGETVVLGLQNGIFAQYILMLDSSWPIRVHARTGSLRPICRSAVGRMILSTKPEAEVLGILRRCNAKESDPRQRMKAAELLAEIQLCRQRGYAHTEGTVTPGRGVIAMLLPEAPGHAPMAIGIGGTVGQLRKSRRRIVDAMRELIGIPSDLFGEVD